MLSAAAHGHEEDAADVAARIEAAEAGLLARWIDRTLDGPPSLQAVFDER